MYILMFTRLTDGTREAVMLVGTFKHADEAQIAMRSHWENRINNLGWDAERSWFEEDQAFCGTETMRDTCRYYIIDTDNPYGFVNDLIDEI